MEIEYSENNNIKIEVRFWCNGIDVFRPGSKSYRA
ncbi:hypothetical protein IWX80_002626 [Flavobacterium sp. CAN_S2]